MSTRVYVTGAGGFVGSVLRQQLAEEWPRAEFVPMPGEIDIRDRDSLARSLRDAAPQYVVHLAAQSFVPDAFKDPATTLDINLNGTLSLLLALRDMSFGGRMLFVGSGDMYGLVPEAELPIDEDRPLRPRNPYAVSKVAAEALCYQWSVSENLDIVMARPFNHIGPGQDPRFAVADFARQIAAMVAEGSPPVLVAGDVDAARDFTDVRDIASAYLKILGKGRRREMYNVCSGTSHTLRDIITMLAAEAGLDVSIERDPARLRPAEQKRVQGNPARLKRDTGWEPRRDLRETLRDTLQYWLDQPR